MEILNTFTEFVTRVSKQINCSQILKDYETHYNLRKFKITEISTISAMQMFQHIVQKFYKNHNPGDSGTWVENELRLFIWTVICYIEINRKDIKKFTKSDWDFFASIFFIKQYNLFQYQARILLDETVKSSKWTEEEDCSLYWIISKDKNAKWNQIAKNLFVKSQKKYLRASKQCRQRWFNHLDPTKLKSEWSLKEYLIMFQQVQQKGKKWASIVKALKEKRSQHSIKNKFNSILKKQLALSPTKTQIEACRELIQRINSILSGLSPQAHDEYLFGCSLKLLGCEEIIKENQDELNKKQTKTSQGDSEISKSRFEIFRKKLENFQCSVEQKANNNRKQGYYKCKNQNIENFITFETFNSEKTSQENDEFKQKVGFEQEIYYDDQLSGNQFLIQQQFDIFYHEQIRGLIEESGLDI